MSEPIAIRAYGGLTRLISPLLRRYLNKRAKAGKEDPARLDERFGRTNMPRPDGPLVWLHGASVGETTMMLPLIDRILKETQANVLVTSGTVTSAELMKIRLPERATHQYIPLDTPSAVNHFLDYWRPDLALWAESEIWPNLIRLTKKRGIPLALINARMSARSIIKWKKHGAKNAQSVFGNFYHILAANASTADGLKDLLRKDIPLLGNLKNAAPSLPADPADVTALQKQIGNRPVWCAASTHAGEDEIVLDAHAAILKKHPKALLILVPRHPERGDDIAALLETIPFARRSLGDTVTPDTQVFLMDTIGELGLAFRAASATLVGGSLLPDLSGHNPLEPARLNNAVLSGPNVDSFAEIYADMFGSTAQRVTNSDDIAKAVSDLFTFPQSLAKARGAARHFAESQADILDLYWDWLNPLMPRDKS